MFAKFDSVKTLKTLIKLAAVVLYGDGMIHKEEYRRRVEFNEREIVHWENRTTEVERKGIELATCSRLVDPLVRLWSTKSDEEKQGLARTLFTELVYDLDTQRIVSFKLKPWADEFLTVRAAFFGKEDDDDTTPTSGGNNGGIELGYCNTTVTNRPLISGRFFFLISYNTEQGESGTCDRRVALGLTFIQTACHAGNLRKACTDQHIPPGSAANPGCAALYSNAAQTDREESMSNLAHGNRSTPPSTFRASTAFFNILS